MPLDLSLAALLNAAGAAFLLLVGLAILALSGRKRRAMLLGALAASMGALYVFQNLKARTFEDAIERQWALIALSLLSAAMAVTLCVDLVRDATRGERRALSWFALGASLAALAGGVFGVATVAQADLRASAPAAAAIVVAYNYVNPLAVAALVAAALRVAAAPRTTARHRRAWLLVALAFGPWVVFVFSGLGATVSFAEVPGLLGTLGLQYDGLQLVSAGLVIASLMMCATNRDEPGLGRLAQLAFATAIAVMLTASLVDARVANSSGWGLYGVLRTIGAALLLLAVAKYDLLGVPLPKFVANRGALAAGTLALLFIVAQIAENFIDARYGILMGGVVAGTFLFAAAPLQRLAERAALGRSAPISADGLEVRGSARRLEIVQPPRDTSRREEAYLDACRLAMRDKRLTRAEEVRLHRLADELGLAPSRAHELLVQAETQAGVA